MLTDTQCRNAKPKDKPYKLPDGKGLYLEVKPNGVKAWRYRFELREGETAKQSLFALGGKSLLRGVKRQRKPRRARPAVALRWSRRGKSVQRCAPWLNRASTRPASGR
jgi:hypothetical protein